MRNHEIHELHEIEWTGGKRGDGDEESINLTPRSQSPRGETWDCLTFAFSAAFA
jgi:hypothetical protein